MEQPAALAWPPNYPAEMIRRLKKRNRMITDPLLRARLMKFYSTHPHEWISDWGITFDPRAKRPNPKLMPFVMFPRQHDYITYLNACYNDKANGLTEKCRDVGATWLCVAFSVWLWLFHPDTVIGWGSNKEANVDKKGDPKAIFSKIRQTIEHLPSWMRPRGYHPMVHGLYMRIVNPANGSAITGESGENMGRSGRTSIYFKDESAHYEHAEMVEAALGDNTDVQIDISSVNGSANVFYRRRMAGEIWLPGIAPTPDKTRVFIFDWRDHPAKTQEWYDKRRKLAEAEGLLHIFAQEVERDYSGSKERVIIKAAWVNAAVDAHIKLGFSDDGEKVAGQDVADGGGDKNAIAIRWGVVLRFIDHWGGEAGDAPGIAIPHCIEHQVGELYYDSVGVGAGFKTGINTMRDQGALPQRLRVMKWEGGAAVLDPEQNIIPGDTDSPTNENQYSNLKAQSWWRTRARFYKTYRAVTYGDIYDPGELISLSSQMPLLEQLKMELSQAIHKEDKKGKSLVDKKPDGAFSPNLADGLVICYNPTRELSILDVI